VVRLERTTDALGVCEVSSVVRLFGRVDDPNLGNPDILWRERVERHSRGVVINPPRGESSMSSEPVYSLRLFRYMSIKEALGTIFGTVQCETAIPVRG
jgi:hypothetical protein